MPRGRPTNVTTKLDEVLVASPASFPVGNKASQALENALASCVLPTATLRTAEVVASVKKRARKEAEARSVKRTLHPNSSYVASLQTENFGPTLVSVAPGCLALRGCVVDSEKKVVHMHSTAFVHLYICPLEFKYGKVNVVMCDCPDMVTARAYLQSLTSDTDYKDATAPGTPLEVTARCEHLKAAMDKRIKNSVGGTLPSIDPDVRSTLLEALVFLDVPDSEVVAMEEEIMPTRQLTKNTREAEGVDVAVIWDSPSSLILSVACTGGFCDRAIVKTDAQGLYKCTSIKCKHHNYVCEHVVALGKWLNMMKRGDESPFCDFSIVNMKTEAPAKDVRDPYIAVSPGLISHESLCKAAITREDPEVCKPDALGKCGKCDSSWDDGDPVAQWITQKDAIVLGKSKSWRVDVYHRPCSNAACSGKKPYTGESEGIFNYSNKTLLCHELGLEYMTNMATGKRPFFGFHHHLMKTYGFDKERCSPLVSNKTLTNALMSFLDHLDVDYKECATCPICETVKPEDRIYIFDGKCSGFRKDLMRHVEDHVYLEEDPHPPLGMSNDYTYFGSSKEEAAAGKAIREYAVSGNQRRDADADDFGEVLKLVKKANKPELCEVLRFMKADFGAENVKHCPEPYIRFLRSVSTVYPTHQLIGKDLLVCDVEETSPLLVRVADGAVLNPTDKVRLSKGFPSLYHLFGRRSEKWKNRIPPAFKDLLKRLAVIASLPYEQADTHSLSASMELTPGETPGDVHLAFMPNHPVCRKLRDYGGKRKRQDDDKPDEDTYSSCSKQILKPRHFTPGMFIMCCPHGLCLGFELLTKFEGPLTLFRLLYRRMKVPPAIVIYDNACALSRAFMKREPWYGSMLKAFLDRFHGISNHVACHEGFMLNSYPPDTKVLGGKMLMKDINSSANEQFNSKLGNVTDQARHMGHTNFLKYMRLYVCLVNKDKKGRTPALQ